MERDPKDYLKLLDDLDFNSHAHVERDSLLLASTQIPCHFNSHAHVERDIVKCKFRKVFSISTHTLTWSVTRKIITLNEWLEISTHTLTWSVTR